ncbi:MAG: hypothetical protein WCT01_00730 [Candidatus Shapirobacteria bacterium]
MINECRFRICGPKLQDVPEVIQFGGKTPFCGVCPPLQAECTMTCGETECDTARIMLFAFGSEYQPSPAQLSGLVLHRHTAVTHQRGGNVT